MSGSWSKYGIAVVPNRAITGLVNGLLNGWTYDYKLQSSQLYEQGLRLKEAADDALGQYAEQLRGQLQELRKALPEPTREEPYPSMDGLAAVKDLEDYIRKVESLRVSVLSAPIPPRDFVWSGDGDYALFLSNLSGLDVDILKAIRDLDEQGILRVSGLLEERRDLLQRYRVLG